MINKRWLVRLCLLPLFLTVGTLFAADKGIVHSLRGTTAIDAPSVSPLAKEWQDGEGKVTRNYVQQPPLIPHTIDGMSIDRDGNTCLMCHQWNADMPGATRVAVSHFIDREGRALATISPRRYFCNQCHVPQKKAQPLIGNRFETVVVE